MRRCGVDPDHLAGGVHQSCGDVVTTILATPGKALSWAGREPVKSFRAG
jgi:hypothetical protein